MDKREKIIKSGMQLFVKQGFENTPTSQISKNANVATGTLFHHFKTKEELINEIYLYVKKSMKSYMFMNLDESLKIKNKIKLIWTDLVKWGYEKKIERQFLEKFYGSNYIDNLTVEQANEGFESSFNVFMQAKKEKIINDFSLDLFTNLTFAMFYSFAKEFSNLKTLSKKKIEESFEVYWGAIKIRK